MAIREEKLTLTSNQIKPQSKRIKTVRSQKPLLWLSIPLRIKVKFFTLADKVQGGVRAPTQSTCSFQLRPTFLWPLNTQISHLWPFTGMSFSQLLAWLDLLTLRPQISHLLSRCPPYIHVCSLRVLADQFVSSLHFPLNLLVLLPESSCP